MERKNKVLKWDRKGPKNGKFAFLKTPWKRSTHANGIPLKVKDFTAFEELG